MAKVFLSHSLKNFEPATITKYMFDLINFANKSHFDSEVFDDRFFLNNDKAEGEETLLQSIVNNKGLVKEREEVLYLMKKVDLDRYPNEQEEAKYRLKKQVKKACPSSTGLRDCIESIDEKYPWSYPEYLIQLLLSFFIFFLGAMFYCLDIYTDIRFSQDMFGYYERNFTQELNLCKEDFIKEFPLTIEECWVNFNKTNCLRNLDVVKKIADDCFDNEERFTDPNDWRIAGTVGAAHCALSILIGIILWGVILIQIGQCCNSKSLRFLPIPIVTRWFKFRLDGELFKNYLWPDRNKNQKSQNEYEAKVKKCKENMDVYDQVINLSLIIESSVEASFQFFFQTVYVLPTLILSFTNVQGNFDWKDWFNWKTFSIVLSFASFAWAVNIIR